MKKILMITTGGILACTPTEKGLVPTLRGRDILRAAGLEAENIHTLDFRLIDSSVMTDGDRWELARLIFENRDNYDAFVITHGTDSCAYTRAYLDCALSCFGKTVVLTGSQLPIGRQGTDAVDNLTLAVNTAQGGYRGVVIAIGGRVIPASLATKVDTESFLAFESVTGEYSDDLPLPRGEPSLLTPERKTALIYITPNLSRDTVKMYSGFDRVIALVLGAGGMPAEREKGFDFLKERGVKVYIKSQCPRGQVEAIYEAHTGVGKFTPLNGTSVEGALYRVMFGRV